MSGVYVLKDNETNLLKIGRASNLKERLSNLRTANPRLELVQWFETDDDSTVEAYVHSKLVKHRKSGEFFEVNSVIEELVQIRAQIKTLECLDSVLTEMLMVRIGACDGVAGWASFSGMNIDRFDASKFRRENPELAQKYIEQTYRRVLRIRPHMNRN